MLVYFPSPVTLPLCLVTFSSVFLVHKHPHHIYPSLDLTEWPCPHHYWQNTSTWASICISLTSSWITLSHLSFRPGQGWPFTFAPRSIPLGHWLILSPFPVASQFKVLSLCSWDHDVNFSVLKSKTCLPIPQPLLGDAFISLPAMTAKFFRKFSKLFLSVIPFLLFSHEVLSVMHMGNITFD